MPPSAGEGLRVLLAEDRLPDVLLGRRHLDPLPQALAPLI